MKNNSDNVKATFFIGIASFLTSGINYLTTPIFTRLISASEYGLISRYNSYYLIISVIATLTLSRPGILSVGLHEYKDNRWSYLSCMLGLITVSSITVGSVFFFFWDFFSGILNIPYSLAFLLFLSCLFIPATTFWTYKQRYEYNWKGVCAVTIGTAILAQAFSVCAVLWFKEYGNANLGIVRLYSANAINLLVAVIIYIGIHLRGKNCVSLKLWKTTLFFALPLIPHYLGFSLLNGLDKIMIGNMIGDDKAGIYSLASVISTVGLLVWQALCVSVTPFMFKFLQTREYDVIRENIKPLLEVIGFCCIAISFLAPEIILVFGTREYMEGIYVIPAVAAGTFMHVLYDLFANAAFLKKKATYIMLSTIIAALANIILNFICIKRFGYISAGYTTYVSYVVLALFHYKLYAYLEGQPLFAGIKITFISVSILLMCVLPMLCYNDNFYRYVFLSLVSIIVFKRRKLYIDSIAKMKV